jgi:prepilin signal peptidase PulO-like enzyme (type II secretory pathway)
MKMSDVKKEKVKIVTMENELNSCVIVYEIMGLQYFRLKSLTYENYKKKPTKVHVVFMVVLVTIVLTLMTSYVVKDHSLVEEDLAAKNILMFAIQHSMNCAMMNCVCVSIVQSFTSTQKIKRIYVNFKEILQIANFEFCCSFDFKLFRNAAFKRMAAMIIFITLLHGTLMSFHIRNEENLIKLLFGAIPILFLFMIVNKFVFYVALINSQLSFLLILVTKMFQPSVKIIENINFHLKSNPSVQEHFRKLHAIRKIYNIIYENALLVNESIGLTILMMLISLVITLTVSGYEIFVIIVGGLPIERLTGEIILIPFCSVI